MRSLQLKRDVIADIRSRSWDGVETGWGGESRVESRSRVNFAVSSADSIEETIEAARFPFAEDGRRDETAVSRGGDATYEIRRSRASAASNGAYRAATCHLRFVNARSASARARVAFDDAALETLRRRLRKMLIGRWKSKDKSSGKGSSGSGGGGGKKKRKFGREGKKHRRSPFKSAPLNRRHHRDVSATYAMLYNARS